MIRLVLARRVLGLGLGPVLLAACADTVPREQLEYACGGWDWVVLLWREHGATIGDYREGGPIRIGRDVFLRAEAARASTYGSGLGLPPDSADP